MLILEVTQLSNRFLLNIKYILGREIILGILQYIEKGNAYSSFKNLDQEISTYIQY